MSIKTLRVRRLVFDVRTDRLAYDGEDWTAYITTSDNGTTYDLTVFATHELMAHGHGAECHMTAESASINELVKWFREFTEQELVS